MSRRLLHEAALAAARDLGARYVLARGYTDQMNAPEYLESLPEIERRMRALVRDHHGVADGRLGIMLSPMLPWALSAGLPHDPAPRGRAGRADPHAHGGDVGVQRADREGARAPSNVHVYREGGCLGPDVQLLGCAWLTPDEIAVVSDTGTPVLLDPTAAMFIGAGMPPLIDLLSHASRPGWPPTVRRRTGRRTCSRA